MPVRVEVSHSDGATDAPAVSTPAEPLDARGVREPSGMLSIRLFGGLDLRLGHDPLPLESPRLRALLAYLVLHRDTPQPRQRVAFVFWPESREAQARTNLRKLLHHLARELPALAACLEIGTSSLRWRTHARAWIDVAAFEDALGRGERGGEEGIAALREAAELYRGDLLDGCYDEWIEPERDRLRRKVLSALEQLTALLEERREYAEAIRHAERLLRFDPLDEGSYRRLMRLHLARGDRSRALRAYHECVATLERELGVTPSAETQDAYDMVLPSDSPSRASHERGRAAGPPLVGRAKEWERVTALWRAAERGIAHVVVVTGEAGIGKTRLLEELAPWCAGRGAAVAWARAYRMEGELAYGLVASWLRSDAIRSHLERLDHATRTELARVLPEIISEDSGVPVPEPLREAEQRARLFATTTRALQSLRAPLLLVADDLQWSDLESLQLAHHLLRSQPRSRLLIAGTARSEDVPDQHPLRELWRGAQARGQVTELELSRLNEEETAALAERVRGEGLGQDSALQLHRDTEGSPLFVIEALRAGWRAGATWTSDKVRAVVESRLAQLTPHARDLAGIAATIGREFAAEELGHAAGMSAELIVSGLDELWRRRIVREHGAHAYDFGHDKLREAAYLGASPAVRADRHARVAQALERLHRGDPSRVSGRVAGHYDQAGLRDAAVAWYERAAESVLQRHASGDAVRFLDRASALVQQVPASPEQEARLLGILTALLAPLSNVYGFGSDRLRDTQLRALELSHRLAVDPPPQLLRSLAVSSLACDDFAAARRYGEQIRQRATLDRDDALLVESDYVLGIAAFWQGQLDGARRHFENAARGPAVRHGPKSPLRFLPDPQVVCMSRLGNTLWLMGESSLATHARDDALALAGQRDHPASLATALVFSALLAVEMQDVDRVRADAAALTALRTVFDTPPTALAGEVFTVFARVTDGDVEAGLQAIRSILADTAGVGHAPGMRALIARVLLGACTVAGDARARLEAAEQLLRMGGAARLWEGEAHLAVAESLELLGRPQKEVAAALDRAVAVAREQGARMIEERAAARRRRASGG